MYRPVKYFSSGPAGGNGDVLSDGSAVPAVILGSPSVTYEFVSPGGVTFSVTTGTVSPQILEVTISKWTSGSGKLTLLSQ